METSRLHSPPSGVVAGIVADIVDSCLPPRHSITNTDKEWITNSHPIEREPIIAGLLRRSMIKVS
jgi:hypothetical protein